MMILGIIYHLQFMRGLRIQREEMTQEGLIHGQSLIILVCQRCAIDGRVANADRTASVPHATDGDLNSTIVFLRRKGIAERELEAHRVAGDGSRAQDRAFVSDGDKHVVAEGNSSQ
jgi:hypothetical protein